jgi:hypothetical protein
MKSKEQTLLEQAYESIKNSEAMNITESLQTLDPIITTLAQAYGFEIKEDKELNKWIVTGYAQYASYHFYWSSDESVKGFLEDLKEFFMEEGSERNR